MEEALNWTGWYVVKYIYLFFIILAVAALEVQIEGKYGWVKNLPTWRIRSKIFGFFMGGKDLTGYMFYMLIILLLFFHLPFFGGVPWTWEAEIEIIFLFLMFSVFWDFLWFILNPYYGLSRFKKSYVYWHENWFLGVPLDYPRGILVSLMIAFLNYPEGILKWALAFAVFSVATFVVIFVNYFQRKADGYRKKHKYMERS